MANSLLMIMGKALYRCTNCGQTFSRKWNAERHNSQKHDEMAIVYNKESKWRSHTGKEGTATFTTTTTTTAVDTAAVSTSTLAQQNSIHNGNTLAKEKPQVPNFVLKDFANASQGNPGSGADDFAEFDKFLKIFEKSMPLIDELDTLLARYKVPTERTKILADTTIQSLLSPNPFKFIKDTIRLHRTEFGFEKAAGSIAVSENISTQQAKIKLKALGWNSPYLKKNKTNAVY
jgi:hypothetical protein